MCTASRSPRVVALASSVCHRPEGNRIEQVTSNKMFARQHGHLGGHQTYLTTQPSNRHDLLSSYIFSHTLPEDESDSSDSADDEDEKDLIQQGYFTGRKLCATQEGWIGLVPTVVEIDDDVVRDVYVKILVRTYEVLGEYSSLNVKSGMELYCIMKEDREK
jgi:hypothetical protein